MKLKLSLLIATALSVAGLSTLTTGCTTTGSPVTVSTNGVLVVFGNAVSPTDVYNLTKLAASAGAATAAQKDTNSIPYLQAAEAVLTATVSSGNYDPNLLKTALQNISFNEARDPNINAGINLAVQTYATIFGAMIDQKLSNTSIYTVPAITGLRDGIQSIVGTVSTNLITVSTNSP